LPFKLIIIELSAIYYKEKAMADIRLKQYAKTLIHYSLYVQKDEWVIIRGSEITMPLITEVYREVLLAGGHPTVMLTPEGLSEILLKEGSDEQLRFNSPIMLEAYKKADKVLTILGSQNLKALSSIPGERITFQKKASAPINTIYKERVAQGQMDWTLCLYPTQSGAQEAGMSLSEYEDFVYNACFLDHTSPVESWKKLHDDQQKMVDFLNQKSDFRIVAADTDLRLSCQKRIWVNSDGHHNFPSGEVFTAPVRESLNGTIRFSFPGIYSGKEIEDIRLVFKDGKVVEATAGRGEDLLLALLDTDEGSRYAGEFAIGTNYGIDRFTRNMLFDEKIGGTIHIALGSSYPECGPVNESLLHWDMLCDMKTDGELYADGHCFYRNGKFII
jgi:aminopeptidase